MSAPFQVLFVLFEHASGYALFRCTDIEDVGSSLPQVMEAMADFARFGRLVQLEAFSPFKTSANALDNINSISEGWPRLVQWRWPSLLYLHTCCKLCKLSSNALKMAT